MDNQFGLEVMLKGRAVECEGEGRHGMQRTQPRQYETALSASNVDKHRAKKRQSTGAGVIKRKGGMKESCHQTDE